MTFKNALVTTVLLAVTAITATAQDRITLRDGESIRAVVKEVSTKTITYKKWDNRDGPDFIISKNKVQSIKYANGSQDDIDDADMDDDDRRRDRRDRYDRRDRDDRAHKFGLSKTNYGKNILSIAPIQMANESAVGFGLQYERVVDKKNIVSIVLPFAMVFYTDDNYNAYNNNYSDRKTRSFSYFYPGIKIYPTGSNRPVSYGVGISAALGFGSKNFSTYNNGTSNYYYEEKEIFKAGLLINNSLNIQPTKNLYLGLELGLGFTYYNGENHYYNNNYSNTFDDGPMVQFSFKLGYRF